MSDLVKTDRVSIQSLFPKGLDGQFLKISGTQAVWGSGGAGSGDVVGPSSSTDGTIVLFDGTTGKLIQDSGVSIGELTDTAAYACDSGVSVNDCVYWDGAALQKSDKSNASTVPVLGIVKAKPSSTTAQLQFIGERTGFSGIVPNTRYYLGSSGGITSTATTTSGDYIVPIGIGKNSSTIELRLSMYMVKI